MATDEGRDRTAAARGKRTRIKHNRWADEMFTAGWHSVAPEVSAEAVLALAVIGERLHGDPERAHAEADRVLLTLVPADVRGAYEALIKSLPWFADA